MCGSGDSRHTTSGGLSPRGKVASLSSRNWGVMLSLSSSRAKIPGKRGALGLVTVAATPDMVLQVCCASARFGTGWKVDVVHAYVGAVGKVGAWAGGNVVATCFLVPAVPTWQACVSARLSGAACLVLCWGSRCSLSAWTCKRVTEDARALMLSRVWSI